MPRKERDYDAILRSISKIRKEITILQNRAKLLSQEADLSESELKDRVAKKDIAMIREVAETINKGLDGGDERIREIERNIQSDRAEFESLER